MWLITTFGFFSVVEKPEQKGTGNVTIRARAKVDLENLKARYLPNASDINEDDRGDYPYRVTATKADVANAMSQAVLDIDYNNFKNEVDKQQGRLRHDIYSEVWGVLYNIQTTEDWNPHQGIYFTKTE